MADFPLPNVREPNEVQLSLVSNTDINRSPLTGKVQTVDRQGERLKITLTWRSVKDADRRRLQAFVARMNGRQHRFVTRDFSYVQAGAFSAPELIDVAFNATNWSPQVGGGTLTDIDEGVRFTLESGAALILRPNGAADGITAPTAGQSYAIVMNARDSRVSSNGGTAPAVRVAFRESDTGLVVNSSSASSSVAVRHVGYGTAPDAAAFFARPQMNVTGTGADRSSVDIASLSASRAPLVDNGVNFVTRSEEFDNGDWTKTRTTINADAVDDPFGDTVADELVEDASAAASHFVEQTYTRSSVSEYWTGSVYIQENTSQRIRLAVYDGDINNRAFAAFDANTGTITESATATGTTSNAYASIHDVGGGWYRCRISVRLAATTSAVLRIYLCDGATNTIVFDGDGTSGLYIWGGQLQRGGQIGRYIETTDAVAPGTAQTGGSLWVKGLDESTDGQLLPGDQVEIAGHMAIVAEQLDGDESGVGLLRIGPRLVTGPDDETPVIVYQPHGKFVLTSSEQSWNSVPGVFSDFVIEGVQDIE